MSGRSLATAACAVLVVVSAQVPAASAEPSPCTAAGRVGPYLVLFDRNTPQYVAASQVANACGTMTGYYPQIAVGVAKGDPGFARRFGEDRAFGTPPAATAPRPKVRSTDPADVPGVDRTAEEWDLDAVGARHGTGSPAVVVGVLDSGIDPAHPELARAVARKDSAGCLTGVPDSGWAPTTSPHGTHVAGIIAAARDGQGTTGVAPGVRVASIKVIDDAGRVTPEAVVCGLVWAAEHHLPITNSSFSVEGVSCTQSSPVVREALARAVDYSSAAGTLNIAAATNDGVNLTRWSACAALPAGLRDVIAVSAVGRDGVKAGYSSYGLGVVDLAAPGGDGNDCVLSTVPGGYASLCGTSMAAPHVSGVAALLASEHPDYRAPQLRRALETSARPIPCPADYDLNGDGLQDAFCAGYTGYNGFYGHGLVTAP